MKQEILDFKVNEKSNLSGNKHFGQTLYSGSEWQDVLADIIRECLNGWGFTQVYELTQIDSGEVFLTVINKKNGVEVIKNDEYEF